MKIKRGEFQKYCEKKEVYWDTFGLILGYPPKSRDFFVKEVMINQLGYKEAYNASGLVTSKDFKASGFSGTGYISNPEEIEMLKAGHTTRTDIIRGINERRVVKPNFPQFTFAKLDVIDCDMEKAKKLLTSNVLPLRDKVILKKFINHPWKITNQS